MSFSNFARVGLLPEMVRKNAGSLASMFLVFQNVVGDAARVHGGVIVEFMPVVRTGLEAKLFGLGAERFLIARR